MIDTDRLIVIALKDPTEMGLLISGIAHALDGNDVRRHEFIERMVISVRGDETGEIVGEFLTEIASNLS